MIEKESSIAAGIRGVQSPGGEKKKHQSVFDVSQPYEEMDEDIFEKMVIEAALENKNITEVVRKKGTLFAMFDDETGSEIAAYKDRETAWEHQRNYRKRKKLEKQGKKKKKQKEKEHEEITKQLFGKKHKTPPKPPEKKVKKEHLSAMFQKILLNENILSYVFEQKPESADSLEWDSFLKGLPKQTIMSDPKLKNALGSLMKAEARILNKSYSVVKSRLSSAGFEISKSKTSSDPETGRIRLDFFVSLYDDGKDAKEVFPFGLRLENGRPLIFIPDQTKQKLNSMNTQNSKLLRAELLYTQESELDNIDDVVRATEKRDNYFRNLEKNLDKAITDWSPIEISLVKKLLRTKFKNV